MIVSSYSFFQFTFFFSLFAVVFSLFYMIVNIVHVGLLKDFDLAKHEKIHDRCVLLYVLGNICGVMSYMMI